MFCRMIIMGMLYFGCSSCVLGQQKKIDSLLIVLEGFKKHDTLKAKLMTEVTELALTANPKKGLVMVKELQNFAAKTKYPKSIFSGIQLEGKYYMITGKMDSAQLLLEKAKAYAISLNNKFFEARSNTGLASIFLMKGKPKEAIVMYKDCIKVFELEKNYDVLGATLVNLANAYNFSGERVLALETALYSLTINNKTNNKNNISTSNYVIGSLYGISGQFKDALVYHKGYTTTQIELGNMDNACAGYIAVASDFKQLQKNDSAAITYAIALKLAKENKNESLVNKISNNLTQIKADEDKNEDAITELVRLNTYYEANGMENERGLILCKLALGYATISSDYFKKNGLDVLKRDNISITYLDEAMAIAKKSSNYPLKEEASRYYALVYEKLQNFVKAFDYYKKYIVLRDSAINESQQIAFDRISQKYIYDKKEDSLRLIQVNTDAALIQQGFLNKQQQQNILLQNKELLLNKQALFANQQQFTLLLKDKELQHLEYLKTQADLQTEQLQNSEKEKVLTLVQKEGLLKSTQVKSLSQENELNKLKRRQLLFYSIAVLATVLFIGLYLFNRNRAKQAQLKVELEKKEAEFQKNIADVSMSALRSQMNPHFIFNCLNSIKLYTTQNDTKAASNYLTKFSKLIRMALENSRSETVALAAELESLELYIQMEAMRFKEKLKYSISVDKKVDSSFIEIPPMLLQPYVENAIWHGIMHKEEGGRIDVGVQVLANENTLAITIKDNGVGRERASRLKSKTATEHKSFGTKLTGERLNLINQIYKTEASVTTEDLTSNGEVTGTLVTIKIPFE
jgi:sensor histidine kinase YesM